MTAIIVGNDKGGVGKDLIAEGIYLAAIQADANPALFEIEVSKRLALLYPGATFISAGAIDPAEIYRNPDSVFAPLDAATAAWRQAELTITSFGANFTGAFQAWSNTNGAAAFGKGKELTFAIVLTMNRDALAAGLSNLFELGQLYPAARRIAVLNEAVADFIEGDKNLAHRLEQARGDGSPIDTVRIRRMAAPAWGYLQNLGPLTKVAQMTAQQLVNLGLPEGPSVRSLALFERWLTDDLIRPLSAILPTTLKPA
jgi:hypothetical protein